MSGLRKLTPWAAQPLSEATKKTTHQAALNLTAESVLLGRHAIFVGWIVGGAGLALFAASIALWAYLLPLKTSVHDFDLIDRTTGIISKPLSVEDAPRFFPQATDEHYLWQYLKACRSWIPEDDRENDHICKIMSSPQQQAKYQEWRNLPSSPMNAIKNEGHVDIDNLHFYPRADDRNTHNYLITYDLTRWRGDQILNKQTWTADIAFQWHPELPMRAADREYNAGGMVVVDFNTTPGMANKVGK